MKVGKRYYWKSWRKGKYVFRSGLLVEISSRNIAILQDKAGLEWTIPVEDLFLKCLK